MSASPAPAPATCASPPGRSATSSAASGATAAPRSSRSSSRCLFLVIFGGLNSGSTLDVRDHLVVHRLLHAGHHGLRGAAHLLQQRPRSRSRPCARTGSSSASARRRCRGARTSPAPSARRSSCSCCRSSCSSCVGVPLFGAHVPGEKLVGMLVTLALGATACSRRSASPRRGSSASRRTAPGLVSVVMLPMVFISNIWYPMDGAPAWVQDISKALPLRPLADGLQAAFDPRYGGTGHPLARPAPARDLDRRRLRAHEPRDATFADAGTDDAMSGAGWLPGRRAILSDGRPFEPTGWFIPGRQTVPAAERRQGWLAITGRRSGCVPVPRWAVRALGVHAGSRSPGWLAFVGASRASSDDRGSLSRARSVVWSPIADASSPRC